MTVSLHCHSEPSPIVILSLPPIVILSEAKNLSSRRFAPPIVILRLPPIVIPSAAKNLPSHLKNTPPLFL